MTNPSSEAREAARTIAMRIDNLLADCNCAGGLKRQFEEYALLEVQAALDNALTAERERRVAAEQIVDHAIAHASYAGTRVMAQEYRTKFPKGDDHG